MGTKLAGKEKAEELPRSKAQKKGEDTIRTVTVLCPRLINGQRVPDIAPIRDGTSPT